MPALLGLFAGPFAGLSWAALALAGAWAWLGLVHDPAVRREYAAERDAQVAAAVAQHQARAIAAMADLEMQQRQAAAQVATVRERIIRVPVTTACAASPAVSAAIGSLRPPPGGAGAPGHPAAPAGLPARP